MKRAIPFAVVAVMATFAVVSLRAAQPGYTGGSSKVPSYEEVSAGVTGT